jgi:predicted ArsR family transcriptional regulator
MKRIPIPDDVKARYQKLEAVRQFLRSEKARVMQYYDNLDAAEQIQNEQIEALWKAVVEKAGFDPEKDECFISLKRNEIIIIRDEEDETGEDS